MKKTLSIILALVMLVSCLAVFAACKKDGDPAQQTTEKAPDASEQTPSESDTAPAESTTEETPTEPPVPSDIEVVKEDYYMFSGSKNGYIVVKNNGAETVKLTCYADAKDAATGEVIYSDKETINAIGPGQESFFNLYFSKAPEDSVISYTIEKSESSKKDVLESLTYTSDFETGELQSSVTVTLTNNGEIPGFHTNALVCCYNEGKLVNTVLLYFLDDDGEIKPGETMTKDDTINAQEKRAFDSIEVYLLTEGSYGY